MYNCFNSFSTKKQKPEKIAFYNQPSFPMELVYTYILKKINLGDYPKNKKYINKLLYY